MDLGSCQWELHDIDRMVTRMAVKTNCQVRIHGGYEVEFLPFYDFFQMNMRYLFMCYEISRIGQLAVASEQALLSG